MNDMKHENRNIQQLRRFQYVMAFNAEHNETYET